MPAIRIPQSAEPLLQFCRRSAEPAENACFDTYADMLAFGAACGFHRLSGRRPSDPKEFSREASTVDLAIFKNQGLFPNLLLIGLGAEGKPDIARDEDQICKLIESFADVGFKYLGHEMKSWTPARFHLEVASLLVEASEGSVQTQI